MTSQDTLRVLEDTLELPAQSLTGKEALRDLPWDSLSTLAFLAAVDQRFGLPLPGSRVARCKSVEELCALVGEATSSRAA